MISSGQAKKLIEKNTKPLSTKNVFLKDALGSVIAQDIRLPLSLPSFNNSAMDGFAFRSADTLHATLDRPVHLKINGTVKAGDSSKRTLNSGEAFSIMTGAMIPHGVDTVIPKEAATVRGILLTFFSPFGRGKNVRYQGEELKKGRKVLLKNIAIHPGTISFLASVGKDRVKVFGKPSVSLIATGSELVRPGLPLRQGKIYDSNSWMVSSCLEKMGLRPSLVKTLPDKPSLLRRTISAALRESDLVVLTGGVSAGDHDYVKTILDESGVREIFWKVSQKPGKPFFFGRKGCVLVFGLPGNPASVFSCFYEYVYPALRRMMGFQPPYLQDVRIPLASDVYPDRSRTLFLKARTILKNNKKIVAPLKHQGSHMISSLCRADSLIIVPPGCKAYKRGRKVAVHYLPYLKGDG